MSDAPDLTAAALTALGFELVVLAAGLGVLLWLILGARGHSLRRVRLGPWTLPPIDFASFLACAFVGAMAVSAAAAYVTRPLRLSDDAATVIGGTVMHVGILAGLGGFVLLQRATLRIPEAPAERLPALTTGVGTFLGAMPLVLAANFGWTWVIRRLGLPEGQQDLVDVLQNTSSLGLKLLLLGVATLLVPVTEELLFRGGLFRYLRTRMPRGLAVALTSLLFGALHVSWGQHLDGLPSLVPLVVLAGVFCVAYEWTGNLRTTMLAHALFNLNTFILVAAGIGT